MTRDRRPVSWIAGCGLLLVLSLAPAVVPAQEADHLLLSEVAVITRPPLDRFGSPFIEVVNPTGEAIELGDVYLSTAQDVANGRFYWNIVAGASQGGGTGGNFHCRFPVGAVIAPGDTMVIALNGNTEFAQAYGHQPDLELYEEGLAPDAIPDMREAFPGAIGAGLGSTGANTPQLQNGAGADDSIVLYHWDGASDLVTDLDYLVYGDATNVRVDKTGVSIDGPDAGDEPSAYLADTAPADQTVASGSPTFGQSFMRAGAAENDEPQEGGNGSGGDDETGENLAASWRLGDDQEPAAAPAAPLPAAPIVTAGEAGAIYADLPTDVAVTALAVDAIAGMTIHHRADGGPWQTVAGSEQEAGVWAGTIPGQAAGSVLEWYVTVTGEGGGVAVWPANGDHLPPATTVTEVPAPEITRASAEAAIPNVPCLVTVEVEAVDLALEGTLHYAIAGGEFESVGMDLDGATLTGEVPGQQEGVAAEWWVEVGDSGGRSDVHPEGAPAEVETLVFSLDNVGAAKLLITEVNAGSNIFPTFAGMQQIALEFVEIHNPNPYPVDLTDYYLTDAISYFDPPKLYWQITDGDPRYGTIGGGHYNDFVARFPAGFTVEPDATIVISMASSGWFERAYGELPDIELYEDEVSVPGVPEMVPVFENPDGVPEGDSIYSPGRPADQNSELPQGLPELEEHYGEPVILFHWVEGDPLVTDIDVFVFGEYGGDDFDVLFAKGPEDGYAPDTPMPDQDIFPVTDETGRTSYTRIDPDEGDQPRSGGNGVGGRDETGENWTDTFAMQPPTPGVFVASAEKAVTALLSVPPRTFLPKIGERFPISVAAPATWETKVRIVDMEGRVVLNLLDSRFDTISDIVEAPTVVRWDGRDETYRRLRAGTYVVHMSSVDPVSGDRIEKTAPVVVATRL